MENKNLENVKDNSYFDGGLLSLILLVIVGGFISTLTLGICYPWAICLIYKWEVEHTVIEGKRLKFTGTGIGLFGNWIKLFLLIINSTCSTISSAVRFLNFFICPVI